MSDDKKSVTTGLEEEFSNGLIDDEPDDFLDDSDDVSETDGDDTDDKSDVNDSEFVETAAVPVKVRKRRKSRKQDSALNDPQQYTYKVQRGFVVDGGETFHPGEVIPVACKYCGLWKTEYLGKVRCFPGKDLPDGTVMSEDRFSCESFFICKELDAELKNFLKMSSLEVLTVKRMLPGLKRVFDALNWVQNYIHKLELDEDLDEVSRSARGFLLAFHNKEQLEYAEDFIRLYAKQHLHRVRAKRPSKSNFRGGDWVEWRDNKTGALFSGCLLTRHRGRVLIAGSGKHHGTKFDLPFSEWVEKCDPKIVQQSVDLKVK